MHAGRAGGRARPGGANGPVPPARAPGSKAPGRRAPPRLTELRASVGAERRLVRLELLLGAELLGDLVPALLDVGHRLVAINLTGEQAGDRGVEHDLLVALVLRNA